MLGVLRVLSRRLATMRASARIAARQPRTGFVTVPIVASTAREDRGARHDSATREGGAAGLSGSDAQRVPTGGRVPAGGFDPELAWGLLAAQCQLGPRNPGSGGHRRTRQLILDRLTTIADDVAVQDWQQRIDRGAGAGVTYPMTNLLGRVRGAAAGDGGPAVLLATHWDTRPVADEDPVAARRALPSPGANDGASGVAVLLEVGRALSVERPDLTVALAFFDGEDLGEYCYGSRLFARGLRRADAARWRPDRAVVIDMIGGSGLRCATETGSVGRAPSLWLDLHDSAADLGLERYFHGPARRITDDHVYLARAGVPSALLIDCGYPYRHTTMDTVAACSPDSLAVIGRVLENFARHGDQRSARHDDLRSARHDDLRSARHDDLRSARRDHLRSARHDDQRRKLGTSTGFDRARRGMAR